jgi:hypothetical protein
MNFFIRHCADRAAGDPLANRCARRSDDTEADWSEAVSVDETDARRAVAGVGPASGQRRRLRRTFTILRHAIDSANSAEKALIKA